MAFRKPQPKKPEETALDLAVAAVEGNPNPLDMDMKGIDPAPTSLDLVGSQQAGTSPYPRGRAPRRCACGRLPPRS